MDVMANWDRLAPQYSRRVALTNGARLVDAPAGCDSLNRSPTLSRFIVKCSAPRKMWEIC